MGVPEEYLRQEDEPQQAASLGGMIGNRSADEVALSNYLSPQQDSSLLGTLGGAAPSSAGALMLPLLLSQMQQRQQISPLGTFANAYAAAQGHPAPIQQGVGMDPLKVMQFASQLVNQQDIMRSREDARQIGKAKLILAEQQNRRAEATQRRQDETAERTSLKPIIDDLIKNGGEAGKRYGWQQRSRDVARVTGQGIPDDVIEEMSKDRLDPTKMKDIIGYAREGVPDETLAAVYKLSPDQLGWVKNIANSPEHIRQLGLQEEDENWKRQERGLKIQKAILDEVKENRAQAHQEFMEKATLATNARMARNEERADLRLAQADKRLDNWERNFNAKMDTKDEKKRTTLAVMKDTLDQTEQEALAMDSKNLLPKSPGWFDTQKARLARALVPSDTNLTNFQKILQGGGVGFERSVMNDIGPRALAAYKGIISFYDNPPTLKAVQSATAKMRRLIDIAESGQAPQRERIVYQMIDPATKQKKTFQADWSPGFNLPPGAKILMVGDEKMD